MMKSIEEIKKLLQKWTDEQTKSGMIYKIKYLKTSSSWRGGVGEATLGGVGGVIKFLSKYLFFIFEFQI